MGVQWLEGALVVHNILHPRLIVTPLNVVSQCYFLTSYSVEITLGEC